MRTIMTALSLKTRVFKGLLAAALSGFAVSCACAANLTWEEAARLSSYDKALSAGDSAIAEKFLKDSAFSDWLKLTDPVKAAALLSKAQAVDDLARLLDKPWRDEQEAELSKALSLRIDFGKPLVKAGIGPVPETLLPWLAGYRRYSARKNDLIKRAIRQFETVFGADTAEGKSEWESSTLRERNIFLAEKASEELEKLIKRESLTDKDFRDRVRGDALFKYLDQAGRARQERYLTQLAAADAAKSKLSAPRLAKINDQPIEQQMYLLGGLFDKSKSGEGALLERKVDGARQSKPGETLSFQNNRLLADMLRTAIPGELKGSAAGDRILKFYNSGAGPAVAIESCQGCYAKYEPAVGRIVLDSEMIQQYLRVNNLTTEALLSDKTQVAALARYLSPIFVHEATHQMQHSWADKAGVYKPYVQEDEIEANSMEALYTIEKLKHDPKFRGLFSKMRSSASYADQRLKLAQRFSRDPGDFSDNVRQLYYYGLPSFEAASSQILWTVSSELKRRKSLKADARNELEKNGVDLKEAMAMTASELISSAAGIKTPALRKIQDDLLRSTVYTGRYEDASDRAVSMLGAARGPEAPKTGPVPAP